MTLDQAKRYFNKGTPQQGVLNLATALGITTQAIYQWGGVIPRAQQLELQQITGGDLRAAPRRRKQAA